MSGKRTYSKIPTPIGVIDALDMNFKVIKEDWNIYDLEDGRQIRARLNVAKISMGIDPKTEKTIIQPNGEPLIRVGGNITIAINTTKELLEK